MSALALAALLLFSGWLTSEDSAGFTQPPPEAKGGTIIPPSLTPPPEAPLAQPTHITIRGQLVPLAPGMTYGREGGTGEGIPEPGSTPPPTRSYREVWEVSYDSNPAEGGYSWISFDENYNLLTNAVRPEDQDEFQPILNALAAP